MTKSFFALSGKAFFLIILSSFILFPSSRDSSVTEILPAKYYPRWLKNSLYHTDQTSGITFLREKDNADEFLLADDIGKIHRLLIKEDTVFSFSEIHFSDEVLDYLSDFPKLDFEEILYDRFNGKVYITIEGNGENHLLYHGIFKLKFLNDDVFQDSVIALEKLNFTPKKIFYNNLEPNTGYEGLAVDENFFYLGLESILTPEGSFSGHSLIRVADKNSLAIIKEITTEDLEISTICGLYSDENYSLWGIDRNQRKIYRFKFDKYFNIVNKNYYEIKTVVPGYNQFEYIGSLESITINNNGFLFLVDDPWHTFFIPPTEILNQLDNTTIKNFKDFIPIIYKFVTE